MAFSDLQIKIASEAAAMGVQPHIANLKYFAKDFSPSVEKPFAGVMVPVYSLSAANEFNEDSNNWCSGQNEVNGVVINLDKHFIKSLKLTDIQKGETDINFLRDGSKALAETLARTVNKYAFETIVAGAELTATAPSDKAGFAGLIKVAADNGINPYESVLVLSPAKFGTLLASLDSMIYGGPDAIRYGVVPNLYGFRAVEWSSYLGENVNGLIIPYDAVGMVTRVNAPAIAGYAAVYTGETEDGFAIGFRAFEHLCKGAMYLGADVLAGVKVLQPGKIVKLV